MKTYRVLVQRPTKRSSETLAEHFCQSEASQEDVRKHYQSLYQKFGISVEEIKEIVTLQIDEPKTDTIIVHNEYSSYSSPGYRFPLNSLNKGLQNKINKHHKLEQEVSNLKIQINKAFSVFMNEAMYNSIDGKNIVSVNGYLLPIVLPKLRLGANNGKS